MSKRSLLARLATVPGPVETGLILWSWLRRMRTALYLLGLVGIATLIATLVPQRQNVPDTVARWLDGTEGPGTTASEIFLTLGFFDVYGSRWFAAIVVLLFTSLTACLIPRYRAYVRMVRRGVLPQTRSPERKQRAARFDSEKSVESIIAEAGALLAERRFQIRPTSVDAPPAPVRSDATGVVVAAPADPFLEGVPTDALVADDADHAESSARVSHDDSTAPRQTVPAQVAAERGLRAREGGSLAFHTSFYIILVAAIAGHLFGFRGQIGVVEGESFAETAVAYWSNMGGRLWDDDWHRGFVYTLDSFEVDWTPDGQADRFISHYTVSFPDGRPDRSGDMRVNDPLVVDGMKVLQLDWGYAPRIVIEEDGEVVYDAFIPLSASDVGFWQGAAKAPAATPQVGLELMLIPTAVDDEDGRPVPTRWPGAEAPLLVFAAWEGDLRLERIQGIHDLDTSEMTEITVDALRPGSQIEIRDGVVVSFPELRRWSGLQISHRPTDPLLLFGAGLVIAALFPALYAYRRRIWVLAEPDPESGHTRVTVAGHAFQRREAFDEEFDAVVRELSGRLGPESPTGGQPAAEMIHR
jgi:cytochrome c biogenesis protein